MRTTLFLSTLFAVSLVGSAALAEHPQGGNQAKAPHVVERLRAHGDTVDKTYRAADRAPATQASAQATPSARPAGRHPDVAAARVNCSDTGADCAAKGGSQQSAGFEASSTQTGRRAGWPPYLDKLLGSDHENFNEAGEDEGMSSRAVKRAWSHAASDRAGASTAKMPLAQQQQVVRTEQQASSDRMSCNEADECMMSSKAAKKVWAYDQVKKGQFTGPAAQQPSPADAAVAAMKGATTTARAGDAAARAKSEKGQQDHDHQH